MRGRDFAFAVLISAERITPAYAGKSKLPLLDYSPAWDHPRVCGEEHAVHQSMTSSLGSPPRMRGREPEKYDIKAEQGITPAYAGKSMLCTNP